MLRGVNDKPMYYYEEVPRSKIPIKSRFAALEMQIFCQEDMQLRGVELIWVQRCSKYQRKHDGRLFLNSVEIKGSAYMQCSLIIINAEFSDPFSVQKTVAHEMRHCWQFREFGAFSAQHFKHIFPNNEQEANAYADDAVLRLSWAKLNKKIIAR